MIIPCKRALGPHSLLCGIFVYEVWTYLERKKKEEAAKKRKAKKQ